jgi:hypothetical protein
MILLGDGRWEMVFDFDFGFCEDARTHARCNWMQLDVCGVESATSARCRWNVCPTPLRLMRHWLMVRNEYNYLLFSYFTKENSVLYRH